MTSSTASLRSDKAFGRPIERHTSETNILKLKLKKPKAWNWELSTSTSSTHIDFPRILLYDDKNRLLADVDDADRIISGTANANNKRSAPASKHSECSLKHSSSFNSTKINRTSSSVACQPSQPNYHQTNPIESHRSGSYRIASGTLTPTTTTTASAESVRKKCKRSASTNSHDVNGFLAKFVSQLNEQGYECKMTRKSSSARSSSKKRTSNTAELNDTVAHNKHRSEAVDRKCNNGEDIHLAKASVSVEQLQAMADSTLTTGPPREHQVKRSKSLNNAMSQQSVKMQTIEPWCSLLQGIERRDKAFRELPLQEYRKPVYHLRKCAAGTIVVPEVELSERLLYRRRHRTPSTSSAGAHDTGFDGPEAHRSPINQTYGQRQEALFDGDAVADKDTSKRCKVLIGDDDGLLNHHDDRLQLNQTHSNADKYPSRYHKAMANIDNLITNVILSHAMHIENNKHHGAESICIDDPNHVLNVKCTTAEQHPATAFCANESDAKCNRLTFASNNGRCRVDGINSPDDNRKNIDGNVVEQSVLIRSENNRAASNGCSDTNVALNDDAVLAVDGGCCRRSHSRHSHSYRHSDSRPRSRTPNNGVNDSYIEYGKQKPVAVQCNRKVSPLCGSDASTNAALQLNRKNARNRRIGRSASAAALCCNALASSISTSTSSSTDENENIDGLRTMQRKKRRHLKQLKKLRTTHQLNGKSILA